MSWGRNNFYPSNPLPRSVGGIDVRNLYFDEGLNQAFESWTVALAENIMQEAREPLAKEAWLVIAAPVSQH